MARGRAFQAAQNRHYAGFAPKGKRCAGRRYSAIFRTSGPVPRLRSLPGFAIGRVRFTAIHCVLPDARQKESIESPYQGTHLEPNRGSRYHCAGKISFPVVPAAFAAVPRTRQGCPLDEIRNEEWLWEIFARAVSPLGHSVSADFFRGGNEAVFPRNEFTATFQKINDLLNVHALR